MVGADDAAFSTHDPWQKSCLCGSFSGGVQCIVLCPIGTYGNLLPYAGAHEQGRSQFTLFLEHIKCRLQTQKSAGPQQYTGSFQTGQKIFAEHGIRRLYQGFWATFWREVPAFGT
jgi:Mitochondrial carrier protein